MSTAQPATPAPATPDSRRSHDRRVPLRTTTPPVPSTAPILPRRPQASGTVAAEYILVQMYASVASGQATPEAAAREAERRARRYFR